jgi:hypothetical protein
LLFTELEVSDAGIDDRRLVWFAMRVGGRVTASRVAAKFLEFLGLFGGQRDAQALVLTASCKSDCAEARSWLSRFAAAAAEEIFREAERSLSETQGSNVRESLAGL